MHAAVERVGRLRIDVALPHEAAECRLDVAGRAAEPVVQIEVAEGGIEIVAPEQAHHAPSEPQAFRIGGRPAQDLLGFGEFVDLLLASLPSAAGGFSAGFGSVLWANAGRTRRTNIASAKATATDTHTEDGAWLPWILGP